MIHLNCLGSISTLSVIILFCCTLEASATTTENKLHRQRRQFRNFYDYYDGFQDYPDKSENFAGQQQNNMQQNQFRPQGQQAANELIFSSNGPPRSSVEPAQTVTPMPNPAPTNAPIVFINNRPTVATMTPFRAAAPASPQFLACFDGCQTTPEYNPICASNMQLYFNEQKFNCAQRCGADIAIVRRGNCEGLFPMMRG